MKRPSFETIFAEYAPRVRAYFLRHGLNRSLADEVAQEVMISVWNNSDRFDPEKGAMSTWVFAIARNRLIDSVRRTRRPEPDPDDPCWIGDRQSQEPTPERATVELSRARKLRTALERLPLEQRKVLEALYFDGQSMSELAESSGTPLGTVKTRARLALKALRNHVGESE
ncbi:MAG TPA: sigma-70 family RNA polymerase sigma factor [Polyangiaceae bacterium]|jgi:RNA polymerase sigma-70 factor (ECF subfamily)|nr:sigma-70 family RNA polymerase sigma factor [Polyangiaceae bacterium]